MAVLGFPSCDSGSYTTPDVKGQLDKRRESFSQRFTKSQEEPEHEANKVSDRRFDVGELQHDYSWVF